MGVKQVRSLKETADELAKLKRKALFGGHPQGTTTQSITKPVTLTVTAFHCGHNPAYKKDACGADAVTTIKRSDFGINYALPAVGDEVKLLIQVEGLKN